MADALKAQANTAFAAQNWNKAIDCWTKAIKKEKDAVALASLYSNRSAAYLKVSKYDAALRDAEQAVLKRPTWSKAKARMAEVYARQQIFDLAKSSYERAIELAEDDATRERYQASLKTTKEAEEKAKSKNAYEGESFQRASSFKNYFLTRLNRAILNGTYTLDRTRGMALSVSAAENCQSGLRTLEENVMRMPDGQLMFRAFTNGLAELCECLITDESAFFLPRGEDPQFPLVSKIQHVILNELQSANSLKYFQNAIWAARDIIADLDKRLATETRQDVRRAVSTIIRGRVVSAGLLGFNKDQRGGAVRELKLALAVLEEGNRKWADVPFDERGNTFRPTFVRNVRVALLKALLAAHRDLKTVAAQRVYKLSDIEDLANQIIRMRLMLASPFWLSLTRFVPLLRAHLQDHPPEEWIPRDGTIMRVAYSAYPNWEAYSALGYVYGQRAGVPLKDIKPRKYAFADLVNAKKAAEFYDKATAIMEVEAPDWHHRRFMLWHALYWHLRAGGLSVREMRQRYNTAKQVSEEAERFFVEMNGVASYGEPRKFSDIQLHSINQNLRHPPPGVTDRSILKPIPTLNCRGLPRSINYQQLLDREEFERLPGDVDAIDVLG
ncbi:hypothetical protein NBRC10512_003529 [Rhodotorula toruloides]|uniref:RHTO0S02e03488g1_1 n=2 Tax=Rhodotorula toruloides TaxID=5286 RepID=A0A061AHD6_RHOTO|nr:TPR-repeat containing protein [Rhodotorula toruloides NP11]EMS22000.1 TPR-repeat containing protein [Rhodotorula toruloides NP11]CDR36536.1 RHTO0S02e03488g1_1 [Rhodotorula toruloides]